MEISLDFAIKIYLINIDSFLFLYHPFNTLIYLFI